MSIQINNLVIKGSVRKQESTTETHTSSTIEPEEIDRIRRLVLDDCRRLVKEQLRRARER